VSTTSERKIIGTVNAPQAIGPYAQAIRYGDLLFVSGVIPINPKTGELLTGNFDAEVRLVLENLEAIIEAGGLSLKNVLKTSVFFKDLDNFGKFNEDLQRIFWRHSPCPQGRSSSQIAARCVD